MQCSFKCSSRKKLLVKAAHKTIQLAFIARESLAWKVGTCKLTLWYADSWQLPYSRHKICAQTMVKIDHHGTYVFIKHLTHIWSCYSVLSYLNLHTLNIRLTVEKKTSYLMLEKKQDTKTRSITKHQQKQISIYTLTLSTTNKILICKHCSTDYKV